MTDSLQTTALPSNSLAVVNQSAPYGNSNGQESLDMVLAMSNFGQTVSVFFVDDGVLQLLTQQQPEKIDNKAYFKTFAALEFYDVENIYVCQQSLKQRGIDVSQLCIPVSLISANNLAEQLAAHNKVMLF